MTIFEKAIEKELEKQRYKMIFTVIFWIIGSILIGYGTNWMIGTGVFFLMWSLAGLLDR